MIGLRDRMREWVCLRERILATRSEKCVRRNNKNLFWVKIIWLGVIHSRGLIDLLNSELTPLNFLKYFFNDLDKSKSLFGGCGTIGRSVVSNTSDPEFKSSLWQSIEITSFSVQSLTLFPFIISKWACRFWSLFYLDLSLSNSNNSWLHNINNILSKSV